jgi:hypothetical protein
VGKVIVARPLACTPAQWEARFRRVAADYDCFALLGADVLDGHYAPAKASRDLSCCGWLTPSDWKRAYSASA